jgi:tetratricopeptide (TPR) repeat protein
MMVFIIDFIGTIPLKKRKKESGREERNMEALHQTSMIPSISMYEETIRIHSRTEEGKKSKEVGLSLHGIGKILFNQGRYVEALAKLEEALVLFTETVGKDDSLVAGVLAIKAACYQRMGHLVQARAMHEEALRINRVACGDGSEKVAASLGNLAGIFYQQGMLADARSKYEEALGIFRSLHGDAHPDVAGVFNSIGLILRAEGHLDKALEMTGKALKIQRQVLGEDHHDVADSLANSGTIFADLGKHEEALERFNDALSIYDITLGADNRQSARVHSLMALSKRKTGDVAGAMKSEIEATRIVKLLDKTRQQARVEELTSMLHFVLSLLFAFLCFFLSWLYRCNIPFFPAEYCKR